MSDFNRHREEELEEQENGELEEENEAEVVEEANEDEITALQNKIAELSDLLLRNRAELENFKRRTNEERIKERKYAMQDYFSEVIDVIDVFDKAVSVKTEDEKLQKFLKGFAMVNMQMKRTLESYGVTKIEALNKPFDPTYHEAFEVVEAEGVESDTVVAVLTEGYMYKDRILRPSVVKVSK